MYLENVNSPEDVKRLDATGLKGLADELRSALLVRPASMAATLAPTLASSRRPSPCTSCSTRCATTTSSRWATPPRR